MSSREGSLLLAKTDQHSPAQVSTTKGTGGDVIILEEAAYCDPQFFYETVAPLMLVGRTSLLAISTLTSEINFYSRLIKMKDQLTQVTRPRPSNQLPRRVHVCCSGGGSCSAIFSHTQLGGTGPTPRKEHAAQKPVGNLPSTFCSNGK